MFKLLAISCVLLSSSVVLGELVKWQQCEEQSDQQCTISNLKVTPCPEAAEGLPCRIKKGRSATIDFDYIPEFAMETVHSQAYWAKGDVDLPFADMDTDGCKSTNCPVQVGAKNSYHWTLDVAKKYPTRAFNIKMKLKSQNAAENNFCCFIFFIKLTK